MSAFIFESLNHPTLVLHFTTGKEYLADGDDQGHTLDALEVRFLILAENYGWASYETERTWSGWGREYRRAFLGGLELVPRRLCE